MLTQRDFGWLINDYHINKPNNGYIGNCGVCTRRRWGGIESTWHIIDAVNRAVGEADICNPCVIHYGFVSDRINLPDLGVHLDIKLKKGRTLYMPCGCGENDSLGGLREPIQVEFNPYGSSSFDDVWASPPPPTTRPRTEARSVDEMAFMERPLSVEAHEQTRRREMGERDITATEAQLRRATQPSGSFSGGGSAGIRGLTAEELNRGVRERSNQEQTTPPQMIEREWTQEHGGIDIDSNNDHIDAVRNDDSDIERDNEI